jgi:hypothetical protein
MPLLPLLAFEPSKRSPHREEKLVHWEIRMAPQHLIEKDILNGLSPLSFGHRFLLLRELDELSDAVYDFVFKVEVHQHQLLPLPFVPHSRTPPDAEELPHAHRRKPVRVLLHLLHRRLALRLGALAADLLRLLLNMLRLRILGASKPST